MLTQTAASRMAAWWRRLRRPSVSGVGEPPAPTRSPYDSSHEFDPAESNPSLCRVCNTTMGKPWHDKKMRRTYSDKMRRNYENK